MAHAQFETIHPFVDGNGRTGRALIHVILRRRGLAPRLVPPISLVLATWSADYVDGLTQSRYRGDPDSQEAVDGTNAWISLFAGACQRAVADAEAYEERVRALQADWQSRLGRVRKNSATELLLLALPGAPIVTVQSAATLVGPQRSGGQRGDPSSCRRWRAQADDRRTTEPRLRGVRADRQLHRPRTSTGEPGRGHADVSAHSTRAVPARRPDPFRKPAYFAYAAQKRPTKPSAHAAADLSGPGKPRIQALPKSPLPDSNRRPLPYHGSALPTELRGRDACEG